MFLLAFADLAVKHYQILQFFVLLKQHNYFLYLQINQIFHQSLQFSTIAILSTPEDDEHATYLAQSLTSQGFIVHAPMYGDMITFLTREELFNELQKVKIQKADIVLVVNTSQKAVESLAEQIYWAEELQKKIIYEHNEEVKEDEA